MIYLLVLLAVAFALCLAALQVLKKHLDRVACLVVSQGKQLSLIQDRLLDAENQITTMNLQRPESLADSLFYPIRKSMDQLQSAVQEIELLRSSFVDDEE